MESERVVQGSLATNRPMKRLQLVVFRKIWSSTKEAWFRKVLGSKQAPFGWIGPHSTHFGKHTSKSSAMCHPEQNLAPHTKTKDYPTFKSFTNSMYIILSIFCFCFALITIRVKFIRCSIKQIMTFVYHCLHTKDAQLIRFSHNCKMLDETYFFFNSQVGIMAISMYKWAPKATN